MASAPSATIDDENITEMTALLPDAKRKHVHCVLVRTGDPKHKQPETFTSREEVYKHLEAVYKDVYPNPDNESGSILLFGLVAKELHKDVGEGFRRSLPRKLPRRLRGGSRGDSAEPPAEPPAQPPADSPRERPREPPPPGGPAAGRPLPPGGG